MRNIEDCPIVSGVGELCPTCPILEIGDGVAFTAVELQGIAIDRRNYTIQHPAYFNQPADHEYSKAANACLHAAMNGGSLDIVPIPLMIQDGSESQVA